ncbi:hypothetical protein POSPLADRAFT_1133701 [Postia placenta MAD-698-R-SB12]|uniref:Uncharacterized protein n=1 Tax=Postia placenta MAD-698-R-SB12 TaxID=670580 RepID=A0A1X6N7I8_9APHY|nr:hypothetical protein POSPLADRAFT_1133701 [Postia placenta MAD-698-R-SB12]OSX64609.1 hypothetical protein POSPLADRAFT_1133701 [Postia placenta MAD-698-R-SB12]
MTTVAPVPMPAPGSRRAPRFKGKELEAFLVDFEKLAKRAGLKDDDLPTEVLSYCSTSVRELLRRNAKFKGKDWDEAKKAMRLFYRDKSEEQVTVVGLRDFAERMRRKNKVNTSRALDEYAIAFGKRMGDLVAQGQMPDKERDVLFFRGLGKDIRTAIRPELRQLKGKKPLVLDPPTMEEVLKEAQDHFNVLDIDYDPESEDDDSGSDTDDNDNSKGKDKKRAGKVLQVKTVKTRATTPDSGVLALEGVARLAEQVRKLTLTMGQSQVFRKADGSVGGVTLDLMREGLVRFSQETGRLVRADGSQLPPSNGMPGGFAAILRREQCVTSWHGA